MTRAWRRVDGSSGMTRNVKPQLRVTAEDCQRTTNPYASVRRTPVPSNPFFAYRAFLRRLRQAA